MRSVSLFICFLSLISPALASPELVVYTARKEHLVKDIFAQYTALTGTKVRYKTGKSAALIQTLKAEGKNSAADLFMTVDAGNLWYAAKEDLLEPIQSKILTQNIPNHLRDVQGRWFGLSVRARTLVYNSDRLKDSDLSTYEDLAKPKWKKRLCLRTSKKVYNQSLVAMLMSELGRNKAREVLKGWVANSVEIFSSDTNVLKAIAAGQCDVGIVNTYYLGRLLAKQPELPLKIFWPNQKSFGVHVNVSGAGILKTSSNKVEAKKFLEWLASREAQNSFAQVNMEYPILDEISPAQTVKDWGEFRGNSSFNLTHAGSLQQEAIRLMHEVGYK